MPDIQSAMQQALNDWANDLTAPTSTTQQEPTMTPAESTGTSRATFNFVRDNPYVTATEAVHKLALLGHNPASTASLIYQMIKQDLFSRDKDGRLTALVKEYRPLKTAEALRKQHEAQQRDKVIQKPPVNIDARAIKNRNTPEEVAAFNAPVARPALAAPMTAEQVLKTLSVKEAFALYRELQTMFG